MKGKVIIFLIALMCIMPVMAQKSNCNQNYEAKTKELMEFKLKFLAETIGLKEDQREEFNKLYTAMENERRTLFKKIKQSEINLKENKNLTDSDYNKALKERAKLRDEMAKIEKKYNDKFATFLTPKQLYNLQAAEEEWMAKVRSCRNKKLNQKK